MAVKRTIGGSKPRHLAGPETALQKMWSAIRARQAAGKPFTRADIEFDTRLPVGTVRGYIERLVAGGYLKGRDKLPKSKTCPHFTWQSYTLALDVGLQAPRVRRDGSEATQGVARERMWQTVRIQREFSALDVQLAVNAAGVKLAYDTAKTYLLKLARAGYFIVTWKGWSGPGKRGTRYRLLPSMNSGPRSPVAQKSGAIYDPNTDKVIWRPGKK